MLTNIKFAIWLLHYRCLCKPSKISFQPCAESCVPDGLFFELDSQVAGQNIFNMHFIAAVKLLIMLTLADLWSFLLLFDNQRFPLSFNLTNAFMDLEKFGIRKCMVKATEQIKCINKCIFAVSFLLKLLMRKMKFKIVLDNIIYKKITYYLCLYPLKVYWKYNEYF